MYLVYYNSKLKVIDSVLMKETNSKDLIYKKPMADTLNFSTIYTMYFTGSKADVSYSILGYVVGIPVALIFAGYLGFFQD